MDILSSVKLNRLIADKLGVEEASVYPQYRVTCRALRFEKKTRGMGAKAASLNDLAAVLTGLLHISAGRGGVENNIEEVEALFAAVRNALEGGDTLPSFGVGGALRKEHRFSPSFCRWVASDVVPSIKENEGKSVRKAAPGERREEIAKMLASGKSQKEVAQALNISRQRVSQVASDQVFANMSARDREEYRARLEANMRAYNEAMRRAARSAA